MYPVGGGRESVWQPGMPVYVGDRIVLRMFASTGDARLAEMRVRLDNEPLRTLTQAPWSIEIDTSNLSPGYHFVEVFAVSSDPSADMGSGATIFYVREPEPVREAAAPEPRTETTVTTGAVQEMMTEEPTTAVAGVRQTPEEAFQPPAHPGREIPMRDGIPLYQAGLDISLHSADPAVEQMLAQDGVVQVTKPTLFRVTVGNNARRIIYALMRNGQEIYRSDPLPTNALIRLQPKTDADSVGLQPGEVSLWVWAGNEEELYGAPDMARVEIAPQQ